MCSCLQCLHVFSMCCVSAAVYCVKHVLCLGEGNAMCQIGKWRGRFHMKQTKKSSSKLSTLLLLLNPFTLVVSTEKLN